MAISMAMAAKVPARPWPLMKMVLYFWGSRPTRPNRLPCSTAPNAGEKKHYLTQHSNLPLFLSGLLISVSLSLTVNKPDSCHGDREEAVFLHGHFDQHCCEDEEQQDKNQATCDAYCLRYPETRNTHIGHLNKDTFYVKHHRGIICHETQSCMRLCNG